MGVADQVDGAVQRFEHAEPEQVELDETGRGAVVLVPLQGAAPRMARPLHRAHLDDGPVAEHHPPRVQAEMAGEVEDLARPGWPTSGGSGPPRSSGSPRSTALAQRVDLLGAVAQGLAHVADGRAGAVGDDVGDLGRGVPAVALVDVGDDLLAPARLDVDVDVGRPVALGGEEPLEQQPQGHGVGAGDAEREADGGVGGRAPALAVDVLAAAELHDVPDDEEVAGEPEGADHLELVVDLGPRTGHPLRRRGPVAVGGAPRRTSSTSQLCSVCPAGTGQSGRPGATRWRSKAHARPSSAARATAPGQRAKRRSCSAPERRWAVAAEGSQPSSSASGRRARTAARVVARGRRAGVA